jgi:hypothetical protein
LLGFHTAKQSKQQGFLKQRFLKEDKKQTKTFATTLDDVEVERLASSSRKRGVVDDFVKKMGGKRSIQKVLIANNGY